MKFRKAEPSDLVIGVASEDLKAGDLLGVPDNEAHPDRQGDPFDYLPEKAPEPEGRTFGIFLSWPEPDTIDAMAAEFGVKPLEGPAVCAVAIAGRLGVYDANALGLEALKRMQS